MKFHPRIALIFLGMCALGTCGLAEDVSVTITDPLGEGSPRWYYCDQPTIDLAGTAGIQTTCFGHAVVSADLSYWADATPGDRLYIDVTTAAEKAAVCVGTELPHDLTGEIITINGVTIPGGPSQAATVSNINNASDQTGVVAECICDYLDLDSVGYGRACRIEITNGTAFLGCASVWDIGMDAAGEVTTNGTTGHVSDPSWKAGSGLTIKDSLGNTIVMTEDRGTSVSDCGSQIDMDLGPVALVTWSNAATGESGTCTGTHPWSVTGITLTPGENPITVTAYDGLGNSGTDTLIVSTLPKVCGVKIASPTQGPVYPTTSATVDLGGKAGVDMEIIGRAVMSADLHDWGAEGPVEISIEVTQAATQAQITGTVDLSGGAGDDWVIEINGVSIAFASWMSLSGMVGAVNGFTSQTNVVASSTGPYLRLTHEDYGSDKGIEVSGPNAVDVFGSAPLSAVGGDAHAAVVDQFGEDITDSSWESGKGLTIQDSLGNTIVMGWYATYVRDRGLQIVVEFSDVSHVTWSNDATGQGGLCTGTADWTADGIELLPGENQMTVTAYNPQGGTGVDDLVVTYYVPAESAGAAKQLEEGSHVFLGDQIVSAGTSELGDCFYMESADRTSGVKVTLGGAQRDTVVRVDGVMATVNGEREIQARYVATVASGSVSALGMNNATVGGGAFGYQGAVWTQSAGLNNIGLLVKTCGRVAETDPGGAWFKIDDGSEVNVKCVVPVGVAVPSADSYVAVTGVSSCEQVGDELHRLIRVRTSDDVQELSP